MDRDLFHQADFIYDLIKILEAKKSKLLRFKDKFTKIMEGHTEIPQEEIFDLFHKIEKMAEYIEVKIQKAYKQIDEL